MHKFVSFSNYHGDRFLRSSDCTKRSGVFPIRRRMERNLKVSGREKSIESESWEVSVTNYGNITVLRLLLSARCASYNVSCLFPSNVRATREFKLSSLRAMKKEFSSIPYKFIKIQQLTLAKWNGITQKCAERAPHAKIQTHINKYHSSKCDTCLLVGAENIWKTENYFIDEIFFL